MSAPIRVTLECGHTRTVDHLELRVECWSCGDVQTVIGAA